MKWLDYWLQSQRTRRVVPYVEPGARVLDIACADGALFRQLGDRAASGVGIDLDPVPPSTAKFEYVQGSFPAAMPTGDPFDVAAALAVVEHIPEKEQAGFAAGCARQLRSGGRLVVTIPSSRVDAVLRVMKAIRVVDGMHEEQHYGFEPQKAVALFEQAGLILERHSRFELGLNHLLVFRKP
jgi:2-polyprenyl-3-methyl-5-hydroxy-6-metoxy-1,4-benzoquinol methylase